MSIDVISNLISSIKNAYMSGKPSIELNHTNMSEDLAKLLKKENYLQEVKVFKEKDSSFKKIHLDLKSKEEIGVVEAERVSTPGRRQYADKLGLQKMQRRGGTVFVSTSRGLMTGKEAIKKNLGGEIICRFY